MAKTLREIMTKDVSCCTMRDNVSKAATIMRDRNVGIVPVVDENNHCIGIVTDRDIVVRGIAENRDGSSSVEQVMSKDVILGRPDMTIDDAAHLMAEQQIRRLPIVDNGRLVGIIAMADLAVRRDLSDEAGQALAQISEPTGRHSPGQQQQLQ